MPPFSISSQPAAPRRSSLWRILPAGLVALLSLASAPPATAQVGQNGPIGFSAKRGADRGLFSRAPDGSQLRLIETGGRADHVSFSPGGRRLAFTKYGPFGAQVWVGYVDGTGMRAVTTGPADTMPAWSPDGADLVFARGGAGRRDLYRVSADGTGLRRLTSSARNDDSPSWSAQGQIAFVRAAPVGAAIYVMDAGGGAPRRLSPTTLPGEPVRGGSRRGGKKKKPPSPVPPHDGAPAWSPTGGTLVFSRGRSGRRDLYVMTADGLRVRAVTRVPGDETDATVSPDGTGVAFTHRAKGAQRLYALGLRGRAVARLTALGTRGRRLTAGGSAARQAAWQRAGQAPVVAVAGDISCDPASPSFNGGVGFPGVCRQKLTSDLLLRLDLAGVLMPGDIQYEDGTLPAFQQAFDPTWGRSRSLLRPAIGNHEYGDPGAAGYFDYFNGPGRATGPAGVRGQGWYSFDAGGWHLIALNSECDEPGAGGCGPDSPQMRWLRADLAANPRACTLAYFHHPLFSSGRYADRQEDVRPFWEALYAAGADVVVSGHDHVYERFAPQTPTGAPDPVRGLRQFTTGMGGKGRHPFVTVAGNSEFRDNGTLGVLALTLREGSYDWKLVAAPRGTEVDAGTGACH